MRQKWIWGLFVFLFGSACLGSPHAHLVVRGDTLSEIAMHHLSGPVYGKTGSLTRLASWNPWIKNLDRIYPGQTIRLEESESTAPLARCLDGLDREIPALSKKELPDLRVAMKLGLAFEKRSETEKAKFLYLTLAKNYPDSALPLSALGELFQNQKKSEKASACFLSALNLSYKHLRTYFHEGKKLSNKAAL